MASRLLVSIENKDQLSPRIDPQLLIGSGRPYGRDKTTFHIRNTRAIQPVSLCAVLNGADQMYGIIMANDQEFFLSLSELKPHQIMSSLPLIDQRLLSRPLPDQSLQDLPGFGQSLQIRCAGLCLHQPLQIPKDLRLVIPEIL